MFVNQAIDTDEKLEKMCPKCRAEATSKDNKCTVCGKSFDKDSDISEFVNPNFDADRYNKLAHGISDNVIEETDEQI